MQSIVNQMQPGWNMGDTLDAKGSETSWNNPKITNEQIQAIADCGFRSIRIPITWWHRIGGAPEYLVRREFVERVRQVVDWSIAAGLYVVIDLHHDADWVSHMAGNRGDVVRRFTALWQQIATAFKNYNQRLLFECLNEPRFSDNWQKDMPIHFQMLEELNSTFVKTVRNVGGENLSRPLILASLVQGCTQPRMDALYNCITKIGDARLLAGVHYYGAYPFSVNVGGFTKLDEKTLEHMESFIERAEATFIKRGVPLVVTEFGLLGFDWGISSIQRGEMLKYFERLTYEAYWRNITMMFWDSGIHFDRNLMQWRDQLMFETLKHGLTGGRSSNAEVDYVFLRKRQVIADISIPLYLHSNTLEEVTLYETAPHRNKQKTSTALHKDGSVRLAKNRVLVNGGEYALSENTLTLKAFFLLSLPSYPLGEVALLRCRFSDGPDWEIRIYQCKKPDLKPSVGTENELVIPTEFNGDVLETMEAFLIKDGEPAGNAPPETWTAFKQYNMGFIPSPEESRITITHEVLGDAPEMLLRFYFLSGQQVEYILTQEVGRVVVGKALD